MVDDSNQTITQGSDPSVKQQVPAVDPAPAVPVDGATSGAQATIPASAPAVPVDGATSGAQATIPASAPAQTQSTAPGGAQQKNPLDVLEQLLSEIDGGKPGSTPVPEKTGPTPDEIAAAELEKRRIEFEEKQAAQKIIDQQKIEEQRQILTQEMSTGVANVARAQQDEEKKVQEEEKASADEGYEILQIDHTKI